MRVLETKNGQEIDALTQVKGVALDDRSSDRSCQRPKMEHAVMLGRVSSK